MKLDTHPGSDRWREQILQAFDDCRSIGKADRLYKRLFTYYYMKKFHAPSRFGEPEVYAEWMSVYGFISDTHRRRLEKVKIS